MDILIGGKKNKYYKENKLAELAGLVGTYIRYTRIDSGIDNFEEYYKEKIVDEKYYYQSQREVNKIVRDEILKSKLPFSARRMKRFYRYEIKRFPKVENQLWDYVKFVMDYILGNPLLLNIAICQIIQPCYNLTKDDGNKDGDCWEFILQWQYNRLSDMANNITYNNTKKRDIAIRCLEEMRNYSLKKFREKCRRVHQTNV